MRRIGRTRIRRGVARRLLRGTAAVAGRRVVPLSVITGIRRIAPARSPLPAVHEPGAARPAADDLARLLDGIELGTWSLGPASIDELVRIVEKIKPAAVIEFGSGVSTLVLAWAMRQTSGPSAVPRIVSFEQDAEHAQRTRDLVARSGFEGECVVLVAPLRDQTIEGVATTCYASVDGLSAVLGDRRAELIVVDGPAGAPGIRFGTLPLARDSAAAGATFVLDDALRDGELDVARRWAVLPYIHVGGMRLIEKGLLTGTMTSR